VNAGLRSGAASNEHPAAITEMNVKARTSKRAIERRPDTMIQMGRRRTIAVQEWSSISFEVCILFCRDCDVLDKTSQGRLSGNGNSGVLASGCVKQTHSLKTNNI